MRYFTKAQVRIVVALNCVIVLLLCGIFLIPGLSTPAYTEPDDKNHNKFRDARISLNVNMDFETNIGGAGNEKLVAAFSNDIRGELHLFGNTDSTSYDMKEESGSIFFIVTDRKAKIQRITTFGTKKDTLVKAVIANEGYLLGIDDSETNIPYLLYIDYQGNVIKTLTHKTASSGKIEDLQLMPEHYLLIITNRNSTGEFWDLQVLFYDLDLNPPQIMLLQNGAYSQQYAGVLQHGQKYIMAVNLTAAIGNLMALVEFGYGSAPIYHSFQMENSYRANGLMPVQGGFGTTIIDEDGRAAFFIINSNFTSREKKYLSIPSAGSGGLFFGGGNYYVFASSSIGSCVHYYERDDFSKNGELAVFSSLKSIDDIYTSSGGVLFAGSDGNASVLSSAGSKITKFSVGGTGDESNVRLLKLGSDFFIVCESTSKDKDVGGNYGGSDIWLAKIKV